MSERTDVIISPDGTTPGDQQAVDELVELTKTKREAAHAAMLAFNLGVKSERKRCAGIADALLPFAKAWNPDRPGRSWGGVAPDDYRVASEALDAWSKDRGCDPPQGPPK